MMANTYSYHGDISESMIMQKPDSATNNKEIDSMCITNGIDNNTSIIEDTDQCINDADDISKTVDMLLVEEQNQQESQCRFPESQVTDNSEIDKCEIETESVALNVADSLCGDLQNQKQTELQGKLQTRLICEICGASVSRSTGLKQHLLNHSDLRPYQCGSCPYSFKNAQSLHRHVKTHNQEHFHLCDTCGKSFSRLEHLKSHQNIHTSNNPHMCKVCNKQFSRADHLSRHSLIHGGEKKISCSHCGKKYGKRYQLTEHMYSHGKEKPLKCEKCDYVCLRPSELKQHIDRVHVCGCYSRGKGARKIDTDKMFKCVHCDFRGAESLELEQHRQCVHGLGEFNDEGHSVTMDLIKSRIESVVNGYDTHEPSETSSMYLIGDAVYQEPQTQIQSSLYVPVQKTLNPHVETGPHKSAGTANPYDSLIESAKKVPFQSMPMGLGQLETYYETHNAVQNMLSQEFSYSNCQKELEEYTPNISSFEHENMMQVQNILHQIPNSDSPVFKTAVSHIENKNENAIAFDLSVNDNKNEKPGDTGNVSDYTDCYDLTENKAELETHNDLGNISDSTDSYDIDTTLPGDSMSSFSKADNETPRTILTYPNMSSCIVTISTNKSATATNKDLENDNNDAIERDEIPLNRKISIIIKTSKGPRQRGVRDTIIKPEAGPYLCDICGKHYVKRENYRSHMRAHSEDFSYICEICKKKFNSKNKLTRHARSHNPNSALLCDTCGKHFSRADHLKDHKLLHLTESPHLCNICFKQFSRADHLKRHRISHSGEKKFSCEICLKQFSQNYSLKEHMYTHGIEKPIQCMRCEKTFVRPSQLKIHMSTHK